MADLTIPLQLAIGAVSGAIADTLTHPLSTVKTRLQCQGAVNAVSGSSVAYKGPFSAFLGMVKSEGILSLYRGLGIVVAAAAPGQALYFSTYEMTKSLLGDSPLSSFIGGACAQLGGSLAWVPMDVVKERLQIEGQVQSSERFAGSLSAMKRIVATEGMYGLYRAYWIHQLTWAPYNGIYFFVYEHSKKYGLENKLFNESVISNLSCSIFSATIACTATSPLDLVKTRLQVQKSNPHIFDYETPLDALRKIIKREGVMALWDGLSARIMWLAPRISIAVSLYEYLKKKAQHDMDK